MLTEEHQRSQTFSWVSPREVLRHASTLSGLDVMQAVASGELPPPPIAVLMQFAPVEVSDGKVVFECTPSEAHYNPIGTVHGGLACTFLDTLVGCAAHTTLPAGVGYTSIDLNVSYLRNILDTSGPLVGTGTVTKRGSRVIFAEGSIVDKDGKLVATGTSSLLVIPPR
ncbi:aromatic compound degradation protein PaaI [Rhodococcus sp. 06-156-3C]|uniref:PaaI family thioesterase n=1 Tax=Nocardiaceae TaxID=85025 RepID=UPI00036168BA|nr:MULTISPECIES: PaaI family thioesterase [Rhodococcus]OZC82511.1 aromatic compound degradation protein PaaI [Rhodococcus sp. 06-418-1B]OZD10079.1 aromatic compound degradation protein PaaI [Rhodococcus sp. 06-156-4C]OZD13980.1 aromatic compound degradation protein PaaI [Rhodococcus sp. 06-156-4a]OZD14668.1 aromatic compound degradation protein PaaI [Rhodococcus sp. 06-156-3C]OZD29749.1 aromatic compound degradation protein PaaI [Rhodococcus sp. 06-156-3]